MFLQEVEATVATFDLKGYSLLAARQGPVDLGAALSRYYEHVESIVTSHDGRIVKFMADQVLVAWLGSAVDDHRRKAIAAVWEAHKKRGPWVQGGVDAGQPVLDYTVGAATGLVLVGQIGTERLKFFDVLGEPVSVAGKLAQVALNRGMDHVLTSETLDSPGGRLAGVEIEGAELGGKQHRLYRLE